MFCQQCGGPLQAADVRCSRCGAPVPGMPGAVATEATWAPTNPTGKAMTGRWIGLGWALVKNDLPVLMAMVAVLAIVSGVIPILLQGPLMLGLYLALIRKMVHGRLEFADLFKCFSLFVPALVATVLISILVSIGTLLCIVPGLVAAAALQFTLLFILDKRMDFWPAMQASHEVVKRDYVGFSLFYLAQIGLVLAGLLLCIVGVLVAAPLIMGATVVAYRETVGLNPATADFQ